MNVKEENNQTSIWGFTIVELLVVIGIIAIIAAAVIVIIAPGEKMKSARESTRAAHFNAIGSAFHLTVVRDNGFGNIAEILLETDCNGDDGETSTPLSWEIARGFTDDCAELVGLGSAPVDPQDDAEYKIKANMEGVAGRLILYTTSTESEWQEENPVIY